MHETNFVGAERELKETIQRESLTYVAEFGALQIIKRKFTPEHAPHFGRLWEASLRVLKNFVRQVLGEVKQTFEEFAIVLVQVEA